MRVDPLDVTSELSPAEPQHRQGLSRFLLSWWFVFLVASPFYVFSSGLPQPGDAFMAVILLTILTGYFVRIPIYHDLYLVAAVFLALVAVVNWSWWTQYRDPKFILSSVFYVYDFAIVVAVLTLARAFGQSLLTWTRAGLIATVLVELAIVVLFPEIRGFRQVGTFNNPNQLGYWALLTGACLLSAKSSPRSGAPDARMGPVDVALLLVLAFIASKTVSRAAIAAMLLLLVAGLYFQGVRPRMKLAIVVLAPVVVLAGIMVNVESVQQLIWHEGATAATNRLSEFGERKGDSWEGRGYDRLWEQPQYLFLGAGEGGAIAAARFTSGPYEIHSTLATVLYSYGILGFALFLTLLWLIFRRAELRHLAYFAPIVAYGLTHQGLRDSLGWVFLGLVFAQTMVYEPRWRLRSSEPSPAPQAASPPWSRAHGRRSP